MTGYLQISRRDVEGATHGSVKSKLMMSMKTNIISSKTKEEPAER